MSAFSAALRRELRDLGFSAISPEPGRSGRRVRTFNSTGGGTRKRGTRRTTLALPEPVLDHPVFEGVVGDRHAPTTRAEGADGVVKTGGTGPRVRR